jgi:POT family proton-dependent oligopeptide transporter
MDIATAVATYTELFSFLMWFGIIAGVIVILISPILKRWMHGIH